jgi:hypothetical protein
MMNCAGVLKLVEYVDQHSKILRSIVLSCILDGKRAHTELRFGIVMSH